MPSNCYLVFSVFFGGQDLAFFGEDRLATLLCCCSFAVYDSMGRKTEVQETVNKDFNFYQAMFAPASKWRP